MKSIDMSNKDSNVGKSVLNSQMSNLSCPAQYYLKDIFEV